jgi:hypothetical protein
MHDQKVNTKATDITSSPSKNVALPPEFVGRIETPYGVQYINRQEASDHASMRSAQMSALLMMMQDEGAARFRILSPRLQESLMWMITELSSEIEAMFDICANDVPGSVQ